MTNSSNNKSVYDLEKRTFLFAKNVRSVLKGLKKDFYNQDDIKQLIRSSGSVGANYIEANESLSKKDFVHRVKISRKEAKESIYWIRLLLAFSDNDENKSLEILNQEATELKKILSSIIDKSQKQ
jgi:four helix bundle protein